MWHSGAISCRSSYPSHFYKQPVSSLGCMEVRQCPGQGAGICFTFLVSGSPERSHCITNITHMKGAFYVLRGLSPRVVWKWGRWELEGLQDGARYSHHLDDSLQRCSLSARTASSPRGYRHFLPMILEDRGHSHWSEGIPHGCPPSLCGIHFHFPQRRPFIFSCLLV